MKLCNAIQLIYMRELARGNAVTVVTNHRPTPEYRASLVVYMQNRLGDYDLSHVECKVFRAPWYPSERYYICTECGCMISGPLENGQRERYWNDRHLPPDERVIATPENVYWTDDDYYESSVPPTIVSSGDIPPPRRLIDFFEKSAQSPQTHCAFREYMLQ